jgi:cholesterol oxidase
MSFPATATRMFSWVKYELAFVLGSQDYYLAGRKEVRHDPVYDLWRDTTTLYTTLHQGTDKTGTVVGAGILTIDLDIAVVAENVNSPTEVAFKKTRVWQF